VEIIQIVGLGLAGAVLLVFVRQIKPEHALFLSIALGVIIFLTLINQILSVLRVLQDLAIRANLNLLYLETILKIIGVAYIAEFGAQVCRDANEGTVAAKIELAGKVLIMVLAVPIVLAILEIIFKLLP